MRLGLRKRSDLENDSARLNPIHIIVVGFAGVFVFVAGLIVLVNWVVVLIGVFFFLLWGGALTAPSKLAAVALVVLSVVSLPSLVEGRSWAKALEGARILFAPLALGLIAIVR